MNIEQPSTTATTIAGSKHAIIEGIKQFAEKHQIVISPENSTFSKQLSGGYHQFNLTFDNDSKVISIMNKNKLVTKFKHTPAVAHDYHMNMYNKNYIHRLYNISLRAPVNQITRSY